MDTESWTDDLERMAQAHVPKDKQIVQTKPEIAIEEIDSVIASGAEPARQMGGPRWQPYVLLFSSRLLAVPGL